VNLREEEMGGNDRVAKKCLAVLDEEGDESDKDACIHSEGYAESRSPCVVGEVVMMEERG
jgi:hypothetical protein